MIALINQITQVIQEIHDIKDNKIPGSNKYYRDSELPDTTSSIVQREHNKSPKGDIDEMDAPYDDKTNDNKLLQLKSS
jgi:hypothetical protein